MLIAQAMLRVAAVLLLLGVAAKSAMAEPVVVRVEEVALGDGRIVRLAGIHVPDGSEAAPVLEAALGTAGEASVRLDPPSPPLDRHGRLRAQLHGAGWVQGEFVRQGLALVAPAPDVPDAVLTALLAIEREAREDRRGLWAEGAQGPWPAARVAVPVGAYVLVQGRVQDVARVQDFVYLNFGSDWRRDFTLRAPAGLARRLAREGLDLEGLEGRNLLVRGPVFETNGPMIELVHPAQIEVLE
jgi:endonuclease YncB( thermonuclease family)